MNTASLLFCSNALPTSNSLDAKNPVFVERESNCSSYRPTTHSFLFGNIPCRWKGFVIPSGKPTVRREGSIIPSGNSPVRGEGFVSLSSKPPYRGEGFVSASGKAPGRGEGFIILSGKPPCRGEEFVTTFSNPPFRLKINQLRKNHFNSSFNLQNQKS